MNRLILALTGVLLATGCSNTRDRRVPAAESSATPPDLTLPDSAALAARGEHPVSPVEQQVVRAPEKARAATTRPAPTRRRHAAKPAVPPADTVTRAYAPQASHESLPAPDTAAAITPTDGNTPPPAPDTASAKPDTIRAATDTARTTDTASTRVADTTSPAGTTNGPITSPTATRTLPVGTELRAALNESINSRQDSVGKTVTASITDNVTGSDGRTLIAAGTPMRLTVTRLTPAKSKGAQGSLVLRVDGIEMNGQLVPVKADVRPVSRELRGRGVTGSDAAKVGVGAAGGAVLGRVLGGSTKGAVIGGVVGAAGGAVVASQTATRDVVVKAKTPMVLVLTEPLTAP